MSEKILFIADPQQNLQKAGCLNDYLRDTVFYGLHELLGDHVVSSTLLTPLYAPMREAVPVSQLWGRGFTTCWLFQTLPNPENDIEAKIADRHYDLIIYGNIWICSDYYSIVSRAYPPKRVAMLDGMDHQRLHPTCVQHIYFKRELHRLDAAQSSVHPVSFAIPTPKITNPTQVIQKTRPLATCVPGNSHTYVFTKEEEYFADYRSSLFALTMKKYGWDCMRHYEIIANRCVPLFFDIGSCPPETMTTFPKDLCVEAIDLLRHFDLDRYLDLERRFFNHLLAHNTSRALAQSILDTCRSHARN